MIGMPATTAAVKRAASRRSLARIAEATVTAGDAAAGTAMCTASGGDAVVPVVQAAPASTVTRYPASVGAVVTVPVSVVCGAGGGDDSAGSAAACVF